MADALIWLVVIVIVAGIVLYLARLLLNKIPMDEDFRQIAWVLLVLVAVVIVILKALPLLGLHVPG